MIFLLTIVYLFIAFWSSLIVGMVLQPESLSNPYGLPTWANGVITISSGLLWPITLVAFICFGLYNKVTGK